MEWRLKHPISFFLEWGWGYVGGVFLKWGVWN